MPEVSPHFHFLSARQTLNKLREVAAADKIRRGRSIALMSSTENCCNHRIQLVEEVVGVFEGILCFLIRVSLEIFSRFIHQHRVTRIN